METKLGHERKLIVCLYEMIGAGLFCTGILISGANATAATMTLFAMIIIFGDVTGGHFNPAVTLGVLVWQFSSKPVANLLFAAMIIVSQCTGAILGGLLSSYILSVDGSVPIDLVAILAPQNTVTNKGEGGFVEDVQTFWS